MVDFFLYVYIYYQTQKIMNVNRFKQLLESKLGNVKPLLFEQNPTGDTPTQNIDQGKTVKINRKDIPMYNEATKTNNTYKQLLFQAYYDIVQKVSEDEATNYNELAIYLKGNAIPYRLNCEDLEKLTELPLESGTETGKPFKIKDVNTKNMLKRYCIAYFPKLELSYRSTTPLYDN